MEESGKTGKPEADSLLYPDGQHIPDLEDVLSQAPAPTEIAIDDVRKPTPRKRKENFALKIMLTLTTGFPINAGNSC